MKRVALIGLAILLAGLAFAWFGARHVGISAAMANAPPDIGPERGAAVMVGGAFGGISLDAMETTAIPWKLTAAALVLEEIEQSPDADVSPATLERILQRFGFIFPDTIRGIPEEFQPTDPSKPLGLTHGIIMPVGGAPVEVANLGCSSCHAGVAYRADGMPDTAVAVPGTPNTSLDLEAYTQAIFVALRRQIDNDALIETAQTLFPDMGWRERLALSAIVRPLARSRISELEGEERALPWSNGQPGTTNGVPALKAQLGVPLLGGGAGETGFVSIPELALRSRRTRLLADGAYGVPSGEADAGALAAITSFFTVPSMGVHPSVAEAHIDDARAVFAWLEDYASPPFPGVIEMNRARAGLQVYTDQCASCHGAFEWNGQSAAIRPALRDYPGWYGDVGTDGLRAAAFTPELAEAVRASPYARYIEVRTGDGYNAPPLAGLWYSAPFLHNGSVHSLAALLDPAQRLPRFMVGGHALDYENVGVRVTNEGGYAAGYVPFSAPQWIDTAAPGRSNSGHTFGADLSDEEQRNLIEFLKLL